MRATTFNRLAADFLKEKRARLGLGQEQYAWELSELVGLQISAISIHYYEAGKHTVPAAVLLAAQTLKKPRRREPLNQTDLTLKFRQGPHPVPIRMEA